MREMHRQELSNAFSAVRMSTGRVNERIIEVEEHSADRHSS
jgi:hypothetical protein